MQSPQHNHNLLATPSPHSFAGVMEMYEQNYMRLRRLIPQLETLEEGVLVSEVAGCLPLHLEVLERCKFTTTFRLTYRFVDENGVRLEPDFHLRIYRDAQQAEAMLRSPLRRDRPSQFPIYATTLDKKWLLNRFLFKWLGYCLMRGHKF